MQMTNAEIVRSFNESADKKKQITILAELNTCREQAIVDILEADVTVNKRALGGWKIAQAKKSAKKATAERRHPVKKELVNTMASEKEWEKHFRKLLQVYAEMHGQDAGQMLKTAEEIAMLKRMAMRITVVEVEHEE
jgi:hypothetical protein